MLVSKGTPFKMNRALPERWMVPVPLNDGSLIYMIFVAPESDFRRFEPT